MKAIIVLAHSGIFKLETEITNYFDNEDRKIIEIANNQTLQYLLDNKEGIIQPVITTAFYGKEDIFHSYDAYEDMLKKGAILLERQIMNFEDALSSWKEYYDMTDMQVELAVSLFKKKVSNPQNIIKLTKEELAKIGDTEVLSLEESKESFEEIGRLF